MQVKSRTLDVAGFRLRMTPLPMSRALEHVAFVVAFIGPLALAGSQPFAALAGVAKALQTPQSRADLQAFCKRFQSCTEVCINDAWVPMDDTHFDGAFTGRLQSLTEWVLAHIALSFEDFLGTTPNGIPSTNPAA